MNHQDFAREWISVWNSHDLESILSHYSDDIEITTPMIAMATGGKESSLKGKNTVRDYWQKALDKFPDLHFELIQSTAGVGSVALFYKSIMDKHAVEVMFFNEEGKINRMYAHYD
ncbi:CbbQ/NirQ/NorQ/GpvN family protein [Chryseobacterium sp. P1-3]|uniref:CbbQ/NirQ/NorQ/GpvN family protein n=1 Tax=Chryseobacterium gallinarum TaxID=1324352 RepID=A0A0G3LYY1_CHRGL|nr:MULTISPECIES: nuclear transport factor 2 family protein [Chryseobacterium]AKK71560.1 CbbQ/NirQ/NorQ/GpvN family protein [Chryseobacterium gallinarum]KFF75435.1 CbbQ/NirQ/NorQ/GpvN family protein [Chryseobacterium sp. P1-3]MCL8538870.1 nuclear transport factor 2 family protein [Chryseobacterium gallinarum]QIY89182.1 nuclear transport factor 2 family protein [Chryseobacterium gallinarum]